jgi:uncharacterized Zn-finger protein
MIKVVCPYCGGENSFEILALLGGRKYELQCLSCGKKFNLVGNEDEMNSERHRRIQD